jgi:hypothetical protein
MTEQQVQQALQVGEMMRRLTAHEEWPVFVQLLYNERVARALIGYDDPDHTREFYAGLLEGMESAVQLPARMASEADTLLKDEQARNARRYEMGGQGEIS